jgi:hypothetical protein
VLAPAKVHFSASALLRRPGIDSSRGESVNMRGTRGMAPRLIGGAAAEIVGPSGE